TRRWYSARSPSFSAASASSRSWAACWRRSATLPDVGGTVVMGGVVVAAGVVVAVPGVVVVVGIEPVPVPPLAAPEDTLHVVIVLFLPSIWSRPSWTVGPQNAP